MCGASISWTLKVAHVVQSANPSNERRDRVVAFVAGRLDPAESVAAVLTEAEISSSRSILGSLRSRRCSVVVTDRRVFIIGESSWTGGPKRISATADRNQVHVTDWDAASGRLVLSGINGAITLQVRLLDAASLQDEATAVVTALSPALAGAASEPAQQSAPPTGALAAPADRSGAGRIVFGFAYAGIVILLVALIAVPVFFLVSSLTSGGGGRAARSASRPPATRGPSRATTSTTAAPRPPAPAASASPTAPQFGRVVYQNSLATPSQGIDAVTSDQFGSALFANEQYVISESKSSSYFTVTPGDLKPQIGLVSAPTIAVDVTATPTKPSDGAYGVMCRSDNGGDSGYIFAILQTGEADITRVDNSRFRNLAALPAGRSPAIATGTAENRIRGICSGADGQPAHLTLVVNGQQVLEATDDQNPLSAKGTFQLFVEDADQPSAVAFSNLVVQVP